MIAWRQNRASWLVLADELVEAGDPLGEIIQLEVAGVDDRHARIRELGRAWEERHPWATFWTWNEESGLVLKLRGRGAGAAFEVLGELRELPRPFRLEIPNGEEEPDRFAFDETWTRLAYIHHWSTSDGGARSRSWDYSLRVFCKLQVFRVADRSNPRRDRAGGLLAASDVARRCPLRQSRRRGLAPVTRGPKTQRPRGVRGAFE